MSERIGDRWFPVTIITTAVVGLVCSVMGLTIQWMNPQTEIGDMKRDMMFMQNRLEDHGTRISNLESVK